MNEPVSYPYTVSNFCRVVGRSADPFPSPTDHESVAAERGGERGCLNHQRDSLLTHGHTPALRAS